MFIEFILGSLFVGGAAVRTCTKEIGDVGFVGEERKGEEEQNDGATYMCYRIPICGSSKSSTADRHTRIRAVIFRLGPKYCRSRSGRCIESAANNNSRRVRNITH